MVASLVYQWSLVGLVLVEMEVFAEAVEAMAAMAPPVIQAQSGRLASLDARVYYDI
ncbi:hypothetical protein [Pantoea sp. App145]|uniref:hypothetical protein n=1 Tax=Pantoea sp. App145 TaxID=3071567 RepID=UPI003A8068D8